MGVNESRSMNTDFHQGCVDNTYISIAPNRGGVPSVVPIERYTWPTYLNADRWIDHAFGEAIVHRLPLPRERKTRDSGNFRF